MVRRALVLLGLALASCDRGGAHADRQACAAARGDFEEIAHVEYCVFSRPQPISFRCPSGFRGPTQTADSVLCIDDGLW